MDIVTPDTLFDRLREHTSALHAEVEAMVPILAPSVTVHDYRNFLSVQWGFHYPIERRLARVPDLPRVLPDVERRWKSRRLEQDLATLGVPAAALPLGEWPAIESVDRALGCLYVVEGSTLGGQLIHRHLAGALPVVAREASRFLTCYGATTGRMWRSFREHVLRSARWLDEDEIVRAACDTFAAVRDWFARSRAPRLGFEGGMHDAR